METEEWRGQTAAAARLETGASVQTEPRYDEHPVVMTRSPCVESFNELPREM